MPCLKSRCVFLPSIAPLECVDVGISHWENCCWETDRRLLLQVLCSRLLNAKHTGCLKNHCERRRDLVDACMRSIGLDPKWCVGVFPSTQLLLRIEDGAANEGHDAAVGSKWEPGVSLHIPGNSPPRARTSRSA